MKLKNYLYLYLGILVIGIAATIFFAKAQMFFAEAQAGSFYIEQYDVQLDVSKERVVHVKEEITVQFTESSHGIIRSIPLNNATIDNVRVSENYSRYDVNGSVALKIGDADRLIIGKNVYTIEYDHKLNDSGNEFYYNIIGTGWEAPIKKAQFYVKIPDKVEDDKVGISIGKYGERGFKSGARYEVKDDEISGYTTRKLSANEGITLRIEVPEGYFTEANNENLKPEEENDENPKSKNEDDENPRWFENQ